MKTIDAPTADAGRREGEARKDAKLRLLEARREVYVLRGRRLLLETMLAGDGTATADDVRAALELPADIDPRCLGSVPGRLAYDHIIGSTGFRKSARPERHASYIQVWRLLDRQGALAWLHHNPDCPDPTDEGEGVAVQGLLFDSQETATPTAGTAGAAH